MPVMLDWAEYTKFFLALIVIVNPVGAVPLFVSMTEQHTVDEKRRIARAASAAVAVVLVLAAIAGQPLLAFFGITIASFKVGGAILILLLAISMMHATPTGEKQTPEEAREAEDKESIAVVPLAIPLLSGPGAISTTIIYSTGRSSLSHILLIIACCLLVSLATWVALRAATPVSLWLGKTGVNIAIRLMGLLLAAVAVEIFTSGILVLLPGLR
ncbi:MAG TPA: NAAT family transporter [Burkholderiales bacterium]|jgi:multiple antibiotic resistance protein|nr:NAAT family transporter [Burkholderiales bacterium]